MNLDGLIQNVLDRCKVRGVLPTVAFREAGVGANFVNNMKNGSAPSVEKVQKLAIYFGCTTSDLLGETSGTTKKSELPVSLAESKLTVEERQLLYAYSKADSRSKEMVRLALEPFGQCTLSEEAM